MRPAPDRLRRRLGAVVVACGVVVAVALAPGHPAAVAGGTVPPVECADRAEACPVALIEPGPAPASPPRAAPPVGLPAAYPLVALQMNLCGSGVATDCYTGARAIREAADRIATATPDIVTLNEVCQRDVLGPLLSAVRAAHPADTVVAAFEPAWNRATRGPFRCTDGDSYGDAVIARAPGGYRGAVVAGGTYPESMQDQADPEERGWVCVDLTGAYYACTSHLVANHPALAGTQCATLTGTDVPGFVAAHGTAPVVVGADLNLVAAPGSPTGVQRCVPAGWDSGSDTGADALQHFLVTGGLTVTNVSALDMAHTTDHPALLLSARAGQRTGAGGSFSPGGTPSPGG